MNTPEGLEQITAQFGDIQPYIGSDGHIDPSWEQDKMAYAVLPFAIPLDWNRATTVARMRCHTLMVAVFESVFEEVVKQSLQSKILTYGGCYAFRPQRTGNRISTHAWGIALDLNPFENQQGSPGKMDAGIIQIFRNAGFKWGGDWQGKAKDPMHFQFATGY